MKGLFPRIFNYYFNANSIIVIVIVNKIIRFRLNHFFSCYRYLKTSQ